MARLAHPVEIFTLGLHRGTPRGSWHVKVPVLTSKPIICPLESGTSATLAFEERGGVELRHPCPDRVACADRPGIHTTEARLASTGSRTLKSPSIDPLLPKSTELFT